MNKIFMLKVALIASLVFNFLSFFFIGKRIYYKNWSYFHQVKFKDPLTQFLNSPDDSIAIVFIGTSLTNSFPLKSYFPNLHIYNFGYSGAMSDAIIDNLSEVVSKKPAKIFLECGINDFRKNRSADVTFKNLTHICLIIKERNPQIRLYVESILPTSYDILNSEINAFNKQLKDFCEKKYILYLDLYNSFLNGNRLDQHLTIDGIHLNETGYFIWYRDIADYVN